MKQSSIEYAKDLVKFIRAEIKKKVSTNKLPDITYQVTKIQKTNLQKIRINFDGKSLESEEKVAEVYRKLKKYFDKYNSNYMSDIGAISLYFSNYLKGECLQELEDLKKQITKHDNFNPY